MADTLTPARHDAAAYATFVRQLYREDPEFVERCYEMLFFGTPHWTGSPGQRIEHAIAADSAGSPDEWMFLHDYATTRR